MDKKHCEFKDKVEKKIYNDLESMYEVIQGADITECLEKRLGLKDIQDVDKRLKISIHYLRCCELIKHILENDENSCGNITYYIESNSLSEMTHLGLGYNFDVKYPFQTTTLYSVGYGKKSNWKEWIKNQNVNENQIKENGMQLIFKACKEHINRGGSVRLKSMSKCFGVDLFKYMQLDENEYANVYIVRNAPVNFVRINQQNVSIQDYLLSNERFDESVQFCIDFTNVRDNKTENYNNWSKRFLSDDKFISKKEFEDMKDKIEFENTNFDYLILNLLKNKHIENGDKAISSRVSPIADREVIVSDVLWEIKEDDNIEEIIDKQCYHFKFSKCEYIQLIFYYFKRYAEKKYLPNNYVERYKNEIIEMTNAITEMTNAIKKKKETLKSDSSESVSGKTESEIEKLSRNKKVYEGIYELLVSVELEKDVPEKVKSILDTIIWENENISPKWSLENIYRSKSKIEENLFCNIYKCICKNLAI